jgi:hypothetical protein
MADASTEKRFGSTLFWRLFALVNLVTVAWVIWLLWQITPRPVVNEFVLHLPYQRTAPPEAAAIPAQNGPPMVPLKLEKSIKTPPK